MIPRTGLNLKFPVPSSSGPRCRLKWGRHNPPVKPTKRKNEKGSDNGEYEGWWDTALVRFQTKLNHTVLSKQPPGRSSFEMALAAKIAKLVKEELKRSVGRIFYRVFAPHFTNSVILITAAPGYQSRRRKTRKGRGGTPYRCAGRNCPNFHHEPRQIGRHQQNGSLLGDRWVFFH